MAAARMFDSTSLAEIEAEFSLIDNEYYNMNNRIEEMSDDSTVEDNNSDIEDGEHEDMSFFFDNRSDDDNQQLDSQQQLSQQQPSVTDEVPESFAVAATRTTSEPISNQQLALKKAANCICKDGCIAAISTYDAVELGRQILLGMTKDCHDLVVLGKLSSFMHRNSTTVNSRRSHQSERQRTRCAYTHEGNPICRNAFMYINAIGDFRLKKLLQHYNKEGNCDSRTFEYGLAHGRNSKALNIEDSQRIKNFLRSVARVHGLDLPGRLPGFKDDSTLERLMILPCDYTKIKLHADYARACEAAGWRSISAVTFRRYWKLMMPNLVISKPKSDLCWTCQKGNMRTLELSNMEVEEKQRLLNDQLLHLTRAKEARQYLNSCVARARQTIGNAVMGKHQPLTGPQVAHYGFDYAQQVFYPNDPLQPDPLYFKVPRKCGLFGVCCTALPHQVNYIIDEAGNTGKGSNSVISMLHHFLENHGLGEKHVILHADNCCGQNKNNHVMAYLAWRVLKGLNLSIEMNFLIAGHTKFPCDLCFGLLKKKYRRTRISNLNELASVVNESSKANTAQLVCQQDGSVVVNHYDWVTFFANARKIPNIKRLHQMTFSHERPGAVVVREYLGADVVEHKMFKSCPEGLPHQQVPDGLPLERQWYLFNEIREFCDARSMDQVCPKPATSIAAAKVNVEPAKVKSARKAEVKKTTKRPRKN